MRESKDGHGRADGESLHFIEQKWQRGLECVVEILDFELRYDLFLI